MAAWTRECFPEETSELDFFNNSILTMALTPGNVGIGAMVTNARLHIASPSDQLVLEDSDGPADAKKMAFQSRRGQFLPDDGQ